MRASKNHKVKIDNGKYEDVLMVKNKSANFYGLTITKESAELIFLEIKDYLKQK